MEATFSQCPLCKADQFAPRYKLSKLRAVQCRRCSLMFLNPYVPPAEMMRFYSDLKWMKKEKPLLEIYHGDLSGTRTEKGFDDCLHKLISYFNKPCPSVLDVAAGTGYFLSRAKRLGWKVKGVDVSAENAQLAKKKHGVEVLASDFESFQTNEKFDCVTLWDFIEHVPDPKGILEKARKMLNPGGFLLIATPNHTSLINFIADLIYQLSLHTVKKPLETLIVPEHILYFTEGTLLKAVKESGLTVREIHKTGTDIDRYKTSPLFYWTAQALLSLSQVLRWENRIIVFAQNPSPK